MTENKFDEHRRRLSGRYSRTHASSAKAPPNKNTYLYNAKVLRKTFGPLLPINRDSSIFEIGCGSGAFLFYLAHEGYARISGMDVDADSIETARQLGVSGVAVGDGVKHLQTQKDAYDCIIAVDVLEHFRKDELFGVLDAVRGALKPGGTLVWRAPNAEGLFFGRLRYGDLTHETAFTRHSAHQLMNAADFIDIKTVGDSPVVTGARSLLRAALWPAVSAVARLYLYAESCETSPILESNLIVCARKP